MARGKAAAQAANRRTAAAHDRIAELEQQLTDERAARRADESKAQDEIRRLRSALINEVDERSATAIKAAEERSASEIRAVREAYQDRVLAGLRVLRKHWPGGDGQELALPMTAYDDLAEAFQVQLGILLNDPNAIAGERTRTMRRSRTGKMRTLHQMDTSRRPV